MRRGGNDVEREQEEEREVDEKEREGIFVLVLMRYYGVKIHSFRKEVERNSEGWPWNEEFLKLQGHWWVVTEVGMFGPGLRLVL